ncbi:MAG: hypothetical protein ACI4TI_01190 [Christensenellales bacterium]
MSRKIIYYSIISALTLLDLYFLYQTIGYAVLGSKAPTLYNGTTAHFMGMYLMSITYAVAFVVVTTIIAVLLAKRKKILKIIVKSSDNIQIV